MKKYVIINMERTNKNEHIYFWKQNKYGYTNILLEAGLFNLEEAMEIVNTSYSDDIIKQVPVVLAEDILELRKKLSK